MEVPTYWNKQDEGSPYFADIAWNKPENKRHSGKLLIIGGNKFSLTAPGIAYQAAVKAGIGTARVILPDAVQKTIGKSFDEGEFAPSNPSGSFSKKALAQVLDGAAWADMVMVAGDLGRNSETAVLLDETLMRYGGPVVLAQDALDYYLAQPHKAVERPNTLLVAELSQLQKIASTHNPPILIKHAMSLHALVGVLNGWTREERTMLLTQHAGNFVLTVDGQVSTTPESDTKAWQVPLAAYAAVWWLQQPNKRFEAITTAIWDYSNLASSKAASESFGSSNEIAS